MAECAHVSQTDSDPQAHSGTLPRRPEPVGDLSGHPKPAVDGHLKTGERRHSLGHRLEAQGIDLVAMANVLNEEKKQQVLPLGRLGWSLRRIVSIGRAA